MTENNKINEEMKELVIARIDAQMPSKLKLFVGSHNGMSKEEMIGHIRKGDEIGQGIIRSQSNFIKSLMDGKFMEAVNSV